MTIDEAIEIKSRALEEFLPIDPVKLVKADRLSIEALERVRYLRTIDYQIQTKLLPSETEDK